MSAMLRDSQWMGLRWYFPLSQTGRRTPLSPLRRHSPAMGRHVQAFKPLLLALSTVWRVSRTSRPEQPLRLRPAPPPSVVARERCHAGLATVLRYAVPPLNN